MRHQRGFTLIELLIALVMMGVVTAGLYSMLIRTQRLTRAQTEQLDLQSNVRTTALVVPSELRELNTVVGAATPGPQVDILEAQPTSIKYRAMRGLGFVCQATTTEIRVLGATWTGYRAPTLGAHNDGAYIFVENLKDLPSDDVWQQTSISSIAAGTCGINAAAFVLTIPAGVLTVAPEAGTPVRTYEVMKLALYQTGGKSYLGAQSVSGGDPALQPLLGPLKDDDNVAPGLKFKYLDAAGNETAAMANIKGIVLTIRGVTEGKISRSGADHIAQGTDSLVTMISLRNAFR
jgi:prepilin-type N-terminal cleavage/methylation domain-containing protein